MQFFLAAVPLFFGSGGRFVKSIASKLWSWE